ncbi:hypothetical protein B7R22_16745 [Subtercola boreus]|uniref:ABC transporter substrate-binding protein n=1 Tax=Subtercola boreus TaxID=120213 RepID=A0A3E0VRQ6_9MICO|nr:extracellular solute-binding protein [Subtercola boreus]RFA12083.1 hypothetical protein B7R22_16745 [Subtercola boreus]
MRKIHRRIALTAAIPVITALAFSGCSSSASSDGSAAGADSTDAAISAVTDAQLQGASISLARFFGDCSDTVGDSTNVSTTVGECATITALTNKFNAENKWGIKVTRLGGASWDSYYDTLNSAFAGGTPPDVAIMHGSSLVDYASRGLLLPTDGLAKITDIDLSDAVPAAKTAIGYDGTDYAVPFDVHAALAHLNVDLWKQAGLIDAAGNPVMPTTADEFLADAKTMKEKTGKNFMGVARSGDQLGVHVFESLLQQGGGDILNADATAGAIDSPQGTTALDFMNKVFAEGYADGNQTYDAAQQSFLGGDTAMLVNGTWVVDQYRTTAPFTYKAANFPTLFGTPAVWADSHTWTIPVQPQADPVKYRAALEFITFLYAHDQDWALGTGHISARTSVLNSDTYKAAPQRANYADTGLTIARPIPHIANWPAVSKALVNAIESNWFQGSSPSDALKSGQANITSALNQ